MTGPAGDDDLGPADERVTYEQHIEAAPGASVYAVLHGDIHIRNGWPVYRLEPFPAAPKPVSPDRAARQPSTLLAAESQVVGFTGREDELSELAQWRDAPAPGVSVMLVHGPGGQGKTRLAARFAEGSAAAGWTVWAAHHLSDPTGMTAVAPGDPGQSLLLIVEYAERWPADDLQLLLQNPVLRRPSRSRVLLVTRPSGPWWPALRHRLRKADIDVGGSIALTSLGRSPHERSELFFSAAESFARVFGISASGLQPPEIRASDEDSYRLILTVHMAALVAVDARARGKDPPSDPTGLSAYLLDREHDCWQSLHDHRAEITTAPEVMSRIVFTATMTRPLSRPRARTALAQIGVLSATAAVSGEEAANHVLDDHAACYPPPEHSAEVLIPLYPDRLGEDFIALATPGHGLTDYQPDEWARDAAARLLIPAGQPGPVGAVSGDDQLAWIRPAAATLIQTALRWPHVARLLEVILRRQPELAQAAGGAALASLVEIDDLDRGVLELVESRFPADHDVLELAPGMAAVTRQLTDWLLPATQDPAERARLQSRLGYRLSGAGLRDEALTATLDAVALRRQLATAGGAEAREDLAFALFNLGGSLGEAGRRNEAAQVAQEAVDIYRSLEADPGSDPRRRADALVNLGATQAELGQWEQALEVTQEAVAAWRPLARADPFAFASSLARALGNLSRLRAHAGRHEAAVAAARESAQIRERLAARDHDRFDDELAVALTSLGTRLVDAGEGAEAATVLTRAVAMLRRLMKLNPDAIAPTLVIALINLAKQHSDLGNWVAGLAAAEEAVSVLEPLAAQNAASFEPGLATALINQSVLLSRLGRKHDAVEASTRATQLVTRLILVNPLRFAPDMASAFAVHAAHLNDVGRREEALEDLENALRMWRKLTAANPAHEPELARSLRNLGLLLSNLGRGKEALSAAQEANALWTKLAADEPRAFDLDLGRSLESLSGRLADEGRTADALAPAEQAVAIFRRLATGSARFQPELAESLGSLSSVLGDLKRWPDALAASREAVTVWERLADGDPEPFEPRLARGLERLLADLSRSGRGRHQDAVPTAERLVAIRRRQVAADPARLPDLATALHGLGAVLRKSGRRREAWAVAWEVGHLGQERDRSSPSPVSSGPPGKPADVRTARALTERARDLASAGRKTEALAAHEEATQMWRTLAHRNSLCRPDLAQSLIKVTILLGETGEPESAIAAGDEAVAIYRQLAPENPEEYEPQLARSLTLTAWSRLLAGQGRLPPCADELAEAAKIYQRLATAQPGTYADPLNTVQSLLADLREGPGNGPNS